MAEKPLKWRWLDALQSEHGPEPVVRHLCHCLAYHMNDDGSGCYPGRRRIASMMGVARSTVDRAVERAVAGGWLLAEARVGGGQPSRGQGFAYSPVIPGSGRTVGPLRGRESGRNAGPLREGESGRTVQQKWPHHATEVAAPCGPTYPGLTQGLTQEGISTIPPSSSSRRGRDGESTLPEGARAVLIEHCLLGSDEREDENGQTIGIGLLLVQLRERVGAGTDVDELLGAVAEVRRDEDAPPPGAAFSLRWFEHPGRLERCRGAFHKRRAAPAGSPASVRSLPRDDEARRFEEKRRDALRLIETAKVVGETPMERPVSARTP